MAILILLVFGVGVGMLMCGMLWLLDAFGPKPLLMWAGMFWFVLAYVALYLHIRGRH
jgi:hypothetical protein